MDHVLASSALPFVFPAIRIGRHWHGDGAIRLPTPLSPAIALGADRIVVVSTNQKGEEDAAEPTGDRYPPPAMIAGSLLNAVMEDRLSDDVRRLRRLNRVLEECSGDSSSPGAEGPSAEVPRGPFGEPSGERREGRAGSGAGPPGLRRVGAFVLRPSVDLGKLAGQYEKGLPRFLRFMVRGLGTREMESPDLLSMLLFAPAYLEKMMEIGERDAEARTDDLRRFRSAEDPAGMASDRS